MGEDEEERTEVEKEEGEKEEEGAEMPEEHKGPRMHGEGHKEHGMHGEHRGPGMHGEGHKEHGMHEAKPAKEARKPFPEHAKGKAKGRRK